MVMRSRTDEPFRIYTEPEYLEGSGVGRALAIETPRLEGPRGVAALLTVAGCVLLALLARQAVLGAGTSGRAGSDAAARRERLDRAGTAMAPARDGKRALSAAREPITTWPRARHPGNLRLVRRPHGRDLRRSRSPVSRRSTAERRGAPSWRSPAVSASVSAAVAPRAATASSVQAGEPTPSHDRRDFTFEHP
jgi:hypothetical protein